MAIVVAFWSAGCRLGPVPSARSKARLGGDEWTCPEEACAGRECGKSYGCSCGKCADGFVCSGDDGVCMDCEEICGENESACGILNWDGQDCDCGTACRNGYVCNHTLNRCMCDPVCADPDTGLPYECGDDGCGGGGTCGKCPLLPPVFECIDRKCVCVPDCENKVCGTDGCSGSCGTCSKGLACGPGGQCYDSCDPVEIEFGPSVHNISHLAVGGGGWEGAAIDVDGDPSTCAPEGYCENGLDNAFSLMTNEEMQKPGAGLGTLVENGDIAYALEMGLLAVLLEFHDPVFDGGRFGLSGYRGKPVLPPTECNPTVGTCLHSVFADSFASGTCVPVASVNNCTIIDGKFKAGGEGLEFPFVIPEWVGESTYFELQGTIRNARLEGVVEVSEDGKIMWVSGVLGGYVLKAEILAAVDAVHPAVFDELPISRDMLKNLLNMFMPPDIDVDGDKEMEAMSVGLVFETVPAKVSGISSN